MKLAPDFDYVKQNKDSNIEFAHRKLTSGDIFFLDNRSNHDESIDATFRVAGLRPELWRAETGATAYASFKISGGRTTVPLHLEPWGTVFVVFRKATSERSRTVLDPIVTTVATLTGPWNVAFQTRRGAPTSMSLNELLDWSKSDDPGVKYFSGIGTYTKSVQALPDWLRKESRMWLDLIRHAVGTFSPKQGFDLLVDFISDPTELLCGLSFRVCNLPINHLWSMYFLHSSVITHGIITAYLS